MVHTLAPERSADSLAGQGGGDWKARSWQAHRQYLLETMALYSA